MSEGASPLSIQNDDGAKEGTAPLGAGPALGDASRSCVRCGACMAVCPLYQVTGRESAVARGKLTLWELYRAGRLTSTSGLRDLMEFCLLCGACEEKCAVGLAVPELVREARADLKARPSLKYRPSWLLARAAWQAPRLIPAAAPFAPVLNRLKDWLGQESGLIFRLWPHLALAAKHFPNLSRTPFRRQAPSYLPGRGSLKVGFFSGCGIEALFPEAGLAFLALCQRLGIEVVVPREQGCCGLLAESMGDLELARAQGKRFLRDFAGLRVDRVVTACASCSYQLKRLGEVLARDPEADAARALSRKVREAGEFLWGEADFRPSPGIQSEKVGYHAPCHFRRGQGMAAAPRELITRATGEPPQEASLGTCCGMGGVFGLTFPRISRELGEARLADFRESGIQKLVTACSGCLIQFQRLKPPFPVVHLLEILC